MDENALVDAIIQGEIAGSKSIEKLDSSLIGNPEDIVKIGSKVYTTKILFDYLRYVYCSKHIDFNNIKRVTTIYI